MITLITGVPGSGKTLYCVDQILTPLSNENDKLQKDGKPTRPIFVDGIPDLILPHELAPDPLEWPKWAPEGAHIFIDEVQRIWRPEAAGRAIPDSIAQLETHRHKGLDFTIMTQHPSLIHSNVRRLVGRHIHVRRTPLGVYVYEYPECMNSPDTAYKNALTKVRWPHPKRSFGAYKSASIHQKVKFRIPKPFIILLLCLAVLSALGTYMYFRLFGEPNSPLAQPSVAQVNQVTGQQIQPQPQLQPPTPEEPDIREQFIPRIQGEPQTAPAYDHLRVVVTMPIVAACIADAERCMCYTQQMTKVDMPDSQCRERVERGAFDPYRDATQERTVGGERTQSQPQTET